MKCRPGCAACCTAPSISSATPKHPQGKPAGIPCGHLTKDLKCGLFGSALRPVVCSSLPPSPEMCCNSRQEALDYLTCLEKETQ